MHKLGQFSYFNTPPIIKYCDPNKNKIIIGNFTNIAQRCTFFLGGNHNHRAVSASASFERFDEFKEIWQSLPEPAWEIYSNGNIIIGNDVWIGYNVTIMSGVHIGNGAIIAANSHVVKDVPDYSIIGGNPAKIIRYRHSSENIKKLMTIKWWDWEISKIKNNLKLLTSENISEFIDLHY